MTTSCGDDREENSGFRAERKSGGVRAQEVPPSAGGFPSPSSSPASLDVDAFLKKAAEVPVRSAPGGPVTAEVRGRLIFAVDATMSRQPTWDLASSVQAEMFESGAEATGLVVQLVCFRGPGLFEASSWVSDARTLGRRMSGVRCLAGRTQLTKVLGHALREAEQNRIAGLIYIGDCFEEAQAPVFSLAGQLALRGVRAFMFHEGRDPVAGRTFKEVARLTGGAYARFDIHAAQTLRDLLRAVAAYASGGLGELQKLAAGETETFKQIVHQLKR